MSSVFINSGAYVSPTGSDVLWWLSKQLSEASCEDRLILLPTQRAVSRMKWLLSKSPEVLERCEVRTYDAACDDGLSDQTRDVVTDVWSLTEDAPLMTVLFDHAMQSFQQKQKFVRSVQSMLSELSFYGVSLLALKRKLDAELFPKLYRLVRALEHMEVGSDSTALQLVQQCDEMCKRIDELDRKVVLVLDGMVPPAVEKLAKVVSVNHLVLAAGQFTAEQISELTFQPIQVYTPRRKLLFQLQQDVPKSVDLKQELEGVSCVESANHFELAERVVDTAVSWFKDGEKVATVVTSNRVVSDFIVHICRLEEVAVDDSFGKTLASSPYAQLMLSGLAWMDAPQDYKRLLTFINSPKFQDYWQGLGEKIDYLGRMRQYGFSETLQRFQPESELEVERLAELKQMYHDKHALEFSQQIAVCKQYVETWVQPQQDFEAKVDVDACLERSKSLDQLQFILESTHVRAITPKAPYIQILGPLESKLLCPKNVIVVDVNEGEWPSRGNGSPWLSADLRADLGLPQQDSFVKASSHAMLSLMVGKRIVLGRTSSADGQATIASRWWQRLKMVSKMCGQPIVPLIGKRQHMEGVREGAVYDYQIPSELRPQRISISDLQLWIQDPGRFVKERVFGMAPLPVWESEADHLQKGIWVHKVLEQAVEEKLDYKAMHALALKALNTMNVSASDQLFWEVEIERYLQNFVALSQSMAPQQTWTEVKGEYALQTQFGAVTIVGKADRIDQMADGSFHITDYKTGRLPTRKAVKEGQYPQLFLLGLMLQKGAFSSISSGKAPFMVGYWGLKSGESQSYLFEDLLQLEGEIIQHVERLLNPETVVAINA